MICAHEPNCRTGEIGAAYAAGLISGRDAIRAAYYRGLYAHLAKSPNGKKGSSEFALFLSIYRALYPVSQIRFSYTGNTLELTRLLSVGRWHYI